MLSNNFAHAASASATTLADALRASLHVNRSGPVAAPHSMPGAVSGAGGHVYLPVSADVQRLLALRTADAEEVESAFAMSSPHRLRLRREASAPAPAGAGNGDIATRRELRDFFARDAGTLLVAGASDHHDELTRLLRGEVVIAAGDSALHRVVRVIPAGVLHKDSTSFRGWYTRRSPSTWHSVYPSDNAGRRIIKVFHLQADGSLRSVQVALHQGRHSYSLDGGLTWAPTGAAQSLDGENVRARAWGRFFHERYQRHHHIRSQASPGHGG